MAYKRSSDGHMGKRRNTRPKPEGLVGEKEVVHTKVVPLGYVITIAFEVPEGFTPVHLLQVRRSVQTQDGIEVVSDLALSKSRSALRVKLPLRWSTNPEGKAVEIVRNSLRAISSFYPELAFDSAIESVTGTELKRPMGSIGERRRWIGPHPKTDSSPDINFYRVGLSIGQGAIDVLAAWKLTTAEFDTPDISGLRIANAIGTAVAAYIGAHDEEWASALALSAVGNSLRELGDDFPACRSASDTLSVTRAELVPK